MHSISVLIKNIRNAIPYLILILIYFTFINIEAMKNSSTNNNIIEDTKINNLNYNEENKIIPIPVIPYN